MTYKICIPFYANIHLLRNCLSGMDVDWRHLLIIDNSENSECKEFEGKGAEILYFPENIGVAKSWNIALRADCDWTFFVSCNAVFPNGFSEVLTELNKATEYAMLTTMAWHCNAISRKCVEQVGYFDENFYPAYFEDTDYYYRMRLAKIPIQIPVLNIPGYSSRQSNSLDKGLQVNFLELEKYYIEKWGGKPGEETYTLAWNKDGIKHWLGQNLNWLKVKYKTE